MERGSPARLHDEDINVRGARNISKLEKLETERVQTTSSKSITTDGQSHPTHDINMDDSMLSSSPEILIDDASQQQRASAVSDNWRSRKTEQRSDLVEQRSGTEVQRYGTDEQRSAAGKLSDTNEQINSTRGLSRRQRNIVAAEMAYRTTGLPDIIECGQVSKRSKVVNTSGRRKPRSGLRGLEDTADDIVDDAMEQAIEALYGKKKRRKMTRNVRSRSAGETRSLDRHFTTSTDRPLNSDYDTTLTENRASSRTINETTSKDASRKKAVSYLTVDKGDEDVDFQRPASADGRLTDRVDYPARRRAQAARRLPHAAAPSRPRPLDIYTSPHLSRYQRRMLTNLPASQQVREYSSETELAQSSRKLNRQRLYSAGDNSDFSTTVEIKNPRSAQFQTEHGGYTSDDSDTRNQQSSTQRRAPTLTKGMVTKILHGGRPQPPTTMSIVSDIHQSAASPAQFTASSPTSIVLSTPADYRDSRMPVVVPVGTAVESRSTYRPSAVDDNFLLQRTPAYQSRLDAGQTVGYGGSGTGRSTPTSFHDDRPPSSYTAFSNEPIIVTDLDDDDTTRMTSMRRTQSLFALDQMSPISRSQTSIYSSRPDISMTNRQVLNLYLFNRRAPRNGGRGRAMELETVTHTMNFDDEAKHIRKGNKQTQTSQRRKPTPTHVTEETVIMKPTITETRETEMVGDVFADRRQISAEEAKTPAARTTRSLVTKAQKESVQEEQEEETLETTVVEEKEQRIEMTIREDLEFSLQRSRGTGKAVTGSTDEGRLEPWWIPATFEAFVERKRQKTTQTKDVENKDDHSKRIDIDRGGRNSSETYDNNSENGSNYETDFGNQHSSRYHTESAKNVRIPIFIEGAGYNSPQHGMTSPSSNLVRTKMTTHSEPKLNRRHQYYMAKRDKYYGSLFDDSHIKPSITDQNNNEAPLLVMSSLTNRRQAHAGAPELRLEVVEDDKKLNDSKSAVQVPRSSKKRYVSSYSQYISPPISSSDNLTSTERTSRSDTGACTISYQPVTAGTGAVFSTSKTRSLPHVKTKNGNDEGRGHGEYQLPESLDHFDRVLTEIEQQLPPPPPPPLPPTLGLPGNQQTENTSSPVSAASQRHYVMKTSTMPSADPLLKPKKYKPLPPEKSWKRSAPLTPKSGKLYSSQHIPTSDYKKQRSAVPQWERQSTSLKVTDKGTSTAADSSQQSTDADFHRELGDRSYISLSLTEPVQTEDQRRRIDVVTRQNAEPGGFTYGWKTEEQKKRKHTQRPGSYQLRHSRWPTDDYETVATAF